VDAHMLVVSGDRGLVELLRPQVENQGCECQVADCYDAASFQLDWADAVLLDLELPGGGLDALRRVRIEAPQVHIIVVATTEVDAVAAEELGADCVLREPFSIADVVEAVRTVGADRSSENVVDLREAADLRVAAAVADERPWWATR
jgi:DNA-binding response OmpR family regulator